MKIFQRFIYLVYVQYLFYFSGLLDWLVNTAFIVPNPGYMNFINGPIYLFIKDVITAVLTVAGLVIAVIGLYTWKKQIKGTKEFETFYDLYYSVLKLRDAIKYVRNLRTFMR